jgi:hypothetical protein
VIFDIAPYASVLARKVKSDTPWDVSFHYGPVAASEGRRSGAVAYGSGRSMAALTPGGRSQHIRVARSRTISKHVGSRFDHAKDNQGGARRFAQDQVGLQFHFEEIALCASLALSCRNADSLTAKADAGTPIVLDLGKSVPCFTLRFSCRTTSQVK